MLQRLILIRRSQGQTYNIVGIYLIQPVFSHRQLYKALSKESTQANIFNKINRNINQEKIQNNSNRLFTKKLLN